MSHSHLCPCFLAFLPPQKVVNQLALSALEIPAICLFIVPTAAKGQILVIFTRMRCNHELMAESLEDMELGVYKQ